MATNDIHIETVLMNGNKAMWANPYLARQEKLKHIKFHNDVDSTVGDAGDGVDITLQFYKIDNGVPGSTPVSGFCEGAGTSIEIKANKQLNCKLALEGDYKFDVTAEVGYPVFDPIIIVEVPTATKGPLFAVGVAVAAVAVTAVAYYFGFKRGSGQR